MIPRTFAELMAAGGPEGLARAAARKAADDVARAHRQLWLPVIEELLQVEGLDLMGQATLTLWRDDLRRRLGLGRSPGVVRELTRDRVRRHRERKRQQEAAACR